MELSIAAKAFFILKKRDKAMSKEEIIREGRNFDWNLNPAALDKAVSFLESLEMLRSAA